MLLTLLSVRPALRPAVRPPAAGRPHGASMSALALNLEVDSRGRNNWDMAFQKTVPIGLTQTTVRFDWLNIFNRPEFRGPVPAVGVPVFGLLDATDGSFARTRQIMVRVAW